MLFWCCWGSGSAPAHAIWQFLSHLLSLGDLRGGRGREGGEESGTHWVWVSLCYWAEGQGDMGFYFSHYFVHIRLPAGALVEEDCLGAVATVANGLDCLHWSGVVAPHWVFAGLPLSWFFGQREQALLGFFCLCLLVAPDCRPLWKPGLECMRDKKKTQGTHHVVVSHVLRFLTSLQLFYSLQSPFIIVCSIIPSVFSCI